MFKRIISLILSLSVLAAGAPSYAQSAVLSLREFEEIKMQNENIFADYGQNIPILNYEYDSLAEAEEFFYHARFSPLKEVPYYELKPSELLQAIRTDSAALWGKMARNPRLLKEHRDKNAARVASYAGMAAALIAGAWFISYLTPILQGATAAAQLSAINTIRTAAASGVVLSAEAAQSMQITVLFYSAIAFSYGILIFVSAEELGFLFSEFSYRLANTELENMPARLGVEMSGMGRALANFKYQEKAETGQITDLSFEEYAQIYGDRWFNDELHRDMLKEYAAVKIIKSYLPHYATEDNLWLYDRALIDIHAYLTRATRDSGTLEIRKEIYPSVSGMLLDVKENGGEWEHKLRSAQNPERIKKFIPRSKEKYEEENSALYDFQKWLQKEGKI